MNTVAYGLAVRFGANSGLTMDGVADVMGFETRLYTLDGSAGITDSPFDAAYWVYDHSWSNPEAPQTLKCFCLSMIRSTSGSGRLVWAATCYFSCRSGEYEDQPPGIDLGTSEQQT